MGVGGGGGTPILDLTGMLVANIMDPATFRVSGRKNLHFESKL